MGFRELPSVGTEAHLEGHHHASPWHQRELIPTVWRERNSNCPGICRGSRVVVVVEQVIEA